jgi:hypothetical protein
MGFRFKKGTAVLSDLYSADHTEEVSYFPIVVGIVRRFQLSFVPEVDHSPRRKCRFRLLASLFLFGYVFRIDFRLGGLNCWKCEE